MEGDLAIIVPLDVGAGERVLERGDLCCVCVGERGGGQEVREEGDAGGEDGGGGVREELLR